MKFVFALVRGALAGALVLVLGVFLYRSYILYASGASLTAVPLPEMLLDVMALHHYAAIGAGVGAAVSPSATGTNADTSGSPAPPVVGYNAAHGHLSEPL